MLKKLLLNSVLVLLAPLLLGGCAANQLAGFQNSYKSYNVPEPLVMHIQADFKKNGLTSATVTRDNVGRIRLTGSYRNEDEVDLAFLIVQSIVGIKSTSPLYPANIQEKRWEIEAKHALERHTQMLSNTSAPPVKRALIVGINQFLDSKIGPIMGEDDAKLVKDAAEKAGYQTTTLLGSKATKKNIEDALQRMSKVLGPNDSLLIYISSHGNLPLPIPQGGDARKMSIVAYDSGNPHATEPGSEYKITLHKTSVADTKVQELAKMPTKQTRVIIDTCYSGEILKGIPDESKRYILKTNGGVPEQAGISMAAWSPSNYASKGILFAEDGVLATQKNQEKKSAAAPQTNNVPADINRYTVITATSDGEKSWGPNTGGSFFSPVNPGKKLQGSFFTQAFFEYLDKHGGHLEPAFRDARNFTAAKVANEVSPQIKKVVQQTPRLNPPLPVGDSSNLYQ